MEDRFRSSMADASLSQYTDAILGLIRNSIRITSQPAEESSFEIGQSRLGGLPDLPPGMEWPTWIPPVYPKNPGLFSRLFSRQPERPEEPEPSVHSFIAQFNLAEVAPYDIEKILPDHGMLYFFFDTNNVVWADDPPHNEGWRVIYWDGDVSQLSRTIAPDGLSQKLIYGSYRPVFSAEKVFPPWESLLVERLGMSEQEIYKYGDVIEEFSSEDDTITRLLGYPDHIQSSDMLTECQLGSNGIASGDLRRLSVDPQTSKLLEGATDWQLLFQMDSQHLSTNNWGDAGRIYYFTKSFEMTQQNLDNVWLVLQCY